jgi:hypothetical protein
MPSQAQFQELQKSYNSLLKKQLPHTPHIFLQRDTYLRPAFLGEWDRLAAAAERQKDHATEGIRALLPLQAELRSLSGKVGPLLDQSEGTWVPLQRRPDWAEVRHKIEEKLEGKASAGKIAAMAKQLGALRMSDMVKRIWQPLDDMAANLDEASESWDAHAVGAELAAAVAAFNKHSGARLGDVRELADWLTASAAVLEGHEKAIWQAMRAGDLKQLNMAATAMGRWTRGKTLDQATKYAAAVARARKRPAARWALGRQAVAIGELIRGLLLGQALARRAGWMAGSDRGAVKEWCDAAARLPFASRWSPPATLKISAIWTRSRQLAGTPVTVEGVVGQVSNEHIRRKVHSSASIADADGASIRVGITHIKMDSGGLVEGAYARISGTFIALDKDFHTPIIRVDQRTYGEDAKRSWTDWKMIHLRRLFTPVPHGLTMAWSWELGEYGAGNQLRYGTWLPFERRD